MPENITAAATPTLSFTLSVPLPGEDVAAAVNKNSDQVHLDNVKAVYNLSTTGLAAAPTAVNLTADIRTLTTTSVNVTTKGTLVTGDGGAGEWYYDPSDTTTPDNTGTVVTAAAGGRWKRKIKNKIYTKWFGCKFDGVTDDAIPLQAAIDAGSALGVEVQAQRGTAITSAILRCYDETNLNGFSLGQSKIKRATGAAIWLLTNDNRASVVGNKNITIRNIEFDGARTSTVDVPARWCVYFSNTQNVKIENCTFKSANSDALCLEYTKDSTVDGCTAYDSAKMGMYFSFCDNLTITNNKIHDVAGAYWGMSVAGTWNSTFTANTIRTCPAGGIVLGRDSRHNTFTANNFPGLSTVREATPSAAYLSTVARPNHGTWDGTTLYGALDNTFVGNTICCASSTANHGVFLVESHRNQFTGNIISEVSNAGFAIYGSFGTKITGGAIFNTGQNPTIGTNCILAIPFNSVNPNNTQIENVFIHDTQGAPTTTGVLIQNASTTGCRMTDCVITIATPIDASTTTLLEEWGNWQSSTAPGSFYVRSASTSKPAIVVRPRDDTTPTNALLQGMDSSGSSQTFRIAKNGDYTIGANKVLGARDTGWTAMTGTGSKAALAVETAGTLPIGATYAQSEIQALRTALINTQARMKSIDDMLTTHGLKGT